MLHITTLSLKKLTLTHYIGIYYVGSFKGRGKQYNHDSAL